MKSIVRHATRNLHYAMQLEIYSTPCNPQSILRHAASIYTTQCNAQSTLRHAASNLYYAMQRAIYIVRHIA